MRWMEITAKKISTQTKIIQTAFRLAIIYSKHKISPNLFSHLIEVIFSHIFCRLFLVVSVFQFFFFTWIFHIFWPGLECFLGTNLEYSEYFKSGLWQSWKLHEIAGKFKVKDCSPAFQYILFQVLSIFFTHFQRRIKNYQDLPENFASEKARKHFK